MGLTSMGNMTETMEWRMHYRDPHTRVLVNYLPHRDPAAVGGGAPIT